MIGGVAVMASIVRIYALWLYNITKVSNDYVLNGCETYADFTFMNLRTYPTTQSL
jgi:hypothetical protein